ncbi:MAG: hypothetical protein R3F48_07270 [Candidatus Zixiibacteriota bacterium]
MEQFWADFGIWLGAVLTLGIISFLYKDNIFYKAAEAIFVGISAGYWFVVFFWDNMVGKFWAQTVGAAPGETQWYPWIGFILGVLMLARLSNKIGWISRWPLAFVVGATAGLYMMIFFVSNAMTQVAATIRPFIQTGHMSIFNSLIIAIGVICGLIYFFFSKEHKGAFGGAAKLGIWFLMITFGASFGYTVMSRMSLMLGRLDFLFGDWLQMIP